MKAPKRMIEKYQDIAPELLGVSFNLMEDVVVKSGSADQPATITAVSTTARVDLDDEVVQSDGLDPTMFNTLKSIYYNHDYEMLPVGVLRHTKKASGGRGWVSQFSMLRHDFARDVATAIDDGAIRGTSIGFRRIDWGDPTMGELDTYGPHSLITRRADWFELSITPMPCNLDAMIAGEKSMIPDDAARALERLAVKGLIGRDSAYAMGLPRPTPTKRIIPIRRLIPIERA